MSVIISKAEAQKWIDILTAFRDGVPLQYLATSHADNWEGVRPTDNYIMIEDIDKYRLKPEPKFRPFTDEEMWSLIGRIIVKKKEAESVPAHILIHTLQLRIGEGVVIKNVDGSWITRDILFWHWTFQDGSKCGVEE